MKKIVTIVILWAACTAWAQNYGLPGYYLTLYPGAAAMASGGGSAAYVDNSDALYLNPAGIGRAKAMEISGSFAKLPTGLNYYPVAFCAPLGKFGSIGIALVGAVSPEAPEIDEFGIEQGTYNAGNNAVSLSYGRSISSIASIGGSLRLATEYVAEYSGIGVGFDFGAQVLPLPWIAFGISLANVLGPSIILDASEETFPTTFTGAIGVRPFEPFFNNSLLRTLTVTFDGQVLDLFTDKEEYEDGHIDYPTRWRCGILFDPLIFVKLRAGANDRTVNAGFGIAVKNISADYGFGYHYGLDELSLGYTHCFGIRYEFGRPLSRQELDVAAKERMLDAREKIDRARQLFIKGDFPASRTLVVAFLENFPHDKEAKEFLVEIDRKVSVGSVAELVARAKDSFLQGDVKEATRLVDKALIIASSDTAAIRLRQELAMKKEVATRMEKVRTLYEQNRQEDAARELDAARSLDSTDSEVRKYLAKLGPFVKKRDADRFVAAATKYYYDKHEVEKANSELQKALELSPDHADARSLYDKISREIKVLYLKKVGQMADNQQLTADDKNLHKLLALDAQDRILHVRSLIDNRQYEQALAETEVLLRESPNDSLVHNLRIKSQELIRRQDAEHEYNEALKLFNEGDLVKAEMRAEKACALSSDDEKMNGLRKDIIKNRLSGNIARVRALIAGGGAEKLAAAKKLTHEYLAADSGNPEAVGLLNEIEAYLLILEADTAIEAGNFKLADQTLQNALRMNPDNAKVQEAFKNLKEAMEALE